MAVVTVLPIDARVASSMAGEGASSKTFWWRRCSEQSRSPRWITLPWLSDVARLLEVLLHVDGIVAERGLGFGARCRESELKFFR